MATLDQVEKLRERANVSYEDAKAALEIAHDDLLEAVIYLERQGKIDGPDMNSYNTRTGGVCEEDDRPTHPGYRDARPPRRRGRRYESDYDRGYDHYHRRGPTIGQQMHYFWQKLCELVRKTNVNQFEVSRDGRSLISMPVTLLIVSLVFFFWVTLPLLVIALFFGCRYRFIGPDFGKDSINNVMDQAAETAENIKRSVIPEEEADDGEDKE